MLRSQPLFDERTRAPGWALLLLAAVLAWPAAVQAADAPEEKAPSFAFPQGTFELRPGTDPATYGFAVSAENLTPPEEGAGWPALRLEDVGGEGPLGLEVEFDPDDGRPGLAEGTRGWNVVLTAEGMDSESEVTRTARLTLGDSSTTVTYKLSNKTGSALAWTLTEGPTTLVLGGRPEDRRTSVVVTAEGQPLSVRLVGVDLRDEATERQLTTAHVRLVDPAAEPAKATGEEEARPPKVAETVLEVLRHSAAPATVEFGGIRWPGKYTGKLTFAATGSKDLKTQSLTVYYSSFWWRFFGLAFIAFGVFVSILISVVVVNLNQRLDSAHKAEVLLQRLEPLRAIVVGAHEKGATPNIDEMLVEIAEQLSPHFLRKQRLLPDVWATDEARAKARQARFENHLTGQEKLISHLEVIVDWGVEELLHRWDEFTDAATRLGQLNGLAVAEKLSNIEVSETRTQVSATLSASNQIRAAGAGRTIAKRFSRLQRLTLSIESLQIGLWVLWAAITIFVGWAAMIATNAGFGTPTDLASCFFWGLGIQAVGAQLQQLTPGKVAGRFKLPVDTGS